MLAFVRAGGRVGREEVVYRDLRLPRSLFSGRDLAGVGYVQRFVDYGGRLEARSEKFVATLPDGLVFEAGSRRVLDTLAMLLERFVDEEYAWLDAKGRVVVDVGANVADSVVYFAKRGAAHVYGYEPDPVAFAAAERNLGLNRIANATVVHAAVQGEASNGHVSFADVIRQASSLHPGLPIVCKIDCEGCEYDLFAPGRMKPAQVDRVSQIMIEYHWRSPQALVTSLEALGFRVETSPGAPGVGWVRAHRSA
ncbi:MAG: hypothetical protein PVSMB9_05680 [Candidatus Dormibacteria bacterium]